MNMGACSGLWQSMVIKALHVVVDSPRMLSLKTQTSRASEEAVTLFVKSETPLNVQHR
jgi:hypothetical protein